MKLDSTTLMDFMKVEARKCIRKRQFAEALGYYQRIAAIDPKDAAVWVMLGNINGWMGDMAAAGTAFEKALELAPDLPEAHCGLGNALCCQKNFPEAIAHYRRALELKPDHAEAKHNLATALDTAGRSDEAEVLYRNMIDSTPTADLYYNLANTVWRLGRLDEAEAYYEEALLLNPAFAPALVNLGNLMFGLHRYRAAEDCYRRALAVVPGRVDALINLGTALDNLGKIDEALETYEAALKLRPNNVRAIAGKAGALEKLGRHQEAAALLRPLLDEGVEAACIANAMAAVCRHTGGEEETIALLQRLIDSDPGTMDPREYLIMHFSVARLLDEAGRYDEAFEYCRRGNRIKGIKHDADAHERLVTALIETFTPEFLASAPRAGTGSDRPLFIVGMPRSGTSLVEQILASHPDVRGGGELTALPHIVAAIPASMESDRPYPQCLTEVTAQQCDEWSVQYLSALKRVSPDARFVTDKMPLNFLHLGMIALLFPGARIVHCRRDALDTCLSCYFHDFTGVGNDFCYDLEDMGRYYRQYRRLMGHWEQVLDLPMLTLNYEDLVNGQERQTRQLLDFCGLPWDEQCLRFNENPRVVATASYDQVRRPLYRESIQRWRNYESHIGDLVRALEMDDGG